MHRTNRVTKYHNCAIARISFHRILKFQLLVSYPYDFEYICVDQTLSTRWNLAKSHGSSRNKSGHATYIRISGHDASSADLNRNFPKLFGVSSVIRMIRCELVRYVNWFGVTWLYRSIKLQWTTHKPATAKHVCIKQRSFLGSGDFYRVHKSNPVKFVHEFQKFVI